MKLNVAVLRNAVLALATIALCTSYAANPVDASLTKPAVPYKLTTADLNQNTSITPGDLAIVKVQAVGTALQYTGLVLTGDGVNANASHPFLKVQSQNGDGNFEYAACYLGNNSSSGSFGLGFFALSSPFSSAVMVGYRSGSTVTLAFVNINGVKGTKQVYTCTGAPAAPGSSIGVNGYVNNTATLDNFTDCPGRTLDTFSYIGTLASSGNWNDAAPGMNANGSVAMGGTLALSFWSKPLASCTVPAANLFGR